jgi:hypothetical protein
MEKYTNHLTNENYEIVVRNAIKLLRHPVQLIRAQVQDFSYKVDIMTADINQALYELSTMQVLLEDGRMESEGELWEFDDSKSKSVAKFSYTLAGDDDWRACKSEMNSLKELRDILSSLKWDLKEKRSATLNLLNKEL